MLILTPSIITSIGSDGYGLWLLILSVMAFFNIIELGFPAAVQRFVTLHLEKGDKDTANAFLTTSLLLFLSLGTVSALSAICVFNYPHVLGLENDYQDTLMQVALIFALKIVMDFSMNPIHAIYSAHLRVDADAALSTLNVIVKSLLIFYIGRHHGVVAMAYCAVLTDVSINLLKIGVARKIYPYWSLNVSNISLSRVLELFNFSKYIIIMAFARMINQRSAPILISNIMSVKAVAIFGVAQNLINHADTLNNSIFHAFSAYFTKLVARGGNMSEYIIKTARLCFLTCLVLAINILIFSQSFIEVWLGDTFAEASLLISIMAFSLLVRPYAMIFRNILVAQANHKNLMYVSLIGSIFTITLIVTLGAEYGTIGVAISFTLVSYLTQFFLYRLAFLKYNAISLKQMDICFIVSFTLCLLALASSSYVSQFVNSWLGLIGAAALINGTLVPLIAYFFLPPDFIALIKQKVQLKL